MPRGVWKQRQRDANQAVKPELLDHTGMEHGSSRGGGAVTKRGPGVKRPERDKDPEAEQEQREDEVLHAYGQRILPNMIGELGNVKRAGSRLQVKGDQPHQRNQSPDAQINRDLEGSVVLLLSPAPDANHNKRRNQRQFMEEVKEKQVERGEGAQDAARHNKQKDIELLLALLYFPRDAGRGERHDGTHEDQSHINAVHANVVANAQAGHPGNLLLELVAGSTGIRSEEHTSELQS